MSKKHAKLSASGSSRWIPCPGSVKAEESYSKKSSAYADEGTLAHEIADLCLKNRKDASEYVGKTLKQLKIEIESIKPSTKITADMARHVQEYVDYVLSHENDTSHLYTEERVDFSNVVPEGFGTTDSTIIDVKARVCHIFDLKYGKGVPVDAFENTQGQLYALGFLNEIGWMDEFDSFRIHIVQPRINNFSYWDITVKDLIKFGRWVTERAELALTDNAPRVPGEKQCQWCLAKHDCGALMRFTEELISAEFDSIEDKQLCGDALTDEQKKVIIDNKKLIITFLDSVEKGIYNRLYEGGEFKGYKLVEGRSNRVYADDAEKRLVEELGDDAYNKRLIGVTEAEKKVGKDIINDITFKPPGKLTMVPDSDKRKAVISSGVAEQFDEIEEDI